MRLARRISSTADFDPSSFLDRHHGCLSPLGTPANISPYQLLPLLLAPSVLGNYRGATFGLDFPYELGLRREAPRDPLGASLFFQGLVPPCF